MALTKNSRSRVLWWESAHGFIADLVITNNFCSISEIFRMTRCCLRDSLETRRFLKLMSIHTPQSLRTRLVRRRRVNDFGLPAEHSQVHKVLCLPGPPPR